MGKNNYTEQELINILIKHTWYLSKDPNFIEDGFSDKKSPLSISVIDTYHKEFIFANPTFRDYYKVGDANLSDWSQEFVAKWLPPETNILYEKLIKRLNLIDTVVSSMFKVKNPASDESYNWRYVTMKLCKENNHLIAIAIPVSNFYKLEDKVQLQTEISAYQKENFHLFLSLTEREKEVLTMTMQGNSNKEVANQLFVSIDTIKQHLKNIRNKVSVKSFAELMRFAEAFYLHPKI